MEENYEGVELPPADKVTQRIMVALYVISALAFMVIFSILGIMLYWNLQSTAQ
jgi:membrane protein insertase Oxa1/YidC/SpoIIIJ